MRSAGPAAAGHGPGGTASDDIADQVPARGGNGRRAPESARSCSDKEGLARTREKTRGCSRTSGSMPVGFRGGAPGRVPTRLPAPFPRCCRAHGAAKVGGTAC